MEPTPTTNGYARIREVYALLRDSEERLTKAFEKQLEAMEERLYKRLDQTDEANASAWERHASVHDDLAGAQATFVAQFDDNKIAAMAKAERTYWFTTTVNAIEDHWKFLTLVALGASVLLNLDMHLF